MKKSSPKGKREKKVIARHKKTGSEYIFAETIKHAPQITSVITENSYPQSWLVKTADIEFLPPTLKQVK